MVAQTGERHDSPGDVADLLVAPDALEQAISIKGIQLVLVIGGEVGTGLLKPAEITGQFRRVLAGIKVAQIPFRQVAEMLGTGCGIGVAGGPGRWIM